MGEVVTARGKGRPRRELLVRSGIDAAASPSPAEPGNRDSRAHEQPDRAMVRRMLRTDHAREARAAHAAPEPLATYGPAVAVPLRRRPVQVRAFG